MFRYQDNVYNTIDEAVQACISGEISKPMNADFLPPADELFEMIKSHHSKYGSKPFSSRSYSPRKLKLKPTFRGGYTTAFLPRDWRMDMIVDHYIGEARGDAVRSGANSFNDAWSIEQELAEMFESLEEDEMVELDSSNMRHAMEKINAESYPFSSTCAIGIVKLLFGRKNLDQIKWLDCSTGWGGFLMASCALGCKYFGADPNSATQAGYAEMISNHGDPSLQTVAHSPFEDIPDEDIMGHFNGKPNLVFMDPPFFNIDTYSKDEGQSITRYPDFMDWVKNFLLVILEKTWNLLKSKGYFVLYVGDNKNVKMTEICLLFMDKLGAKFVGVVGKGGTSSNGKLSIKNVYIFSKVTTSSHFNCTLNSVYPKLFKKASGEGSSS